MTSRSTGRHPAAAAVLAAVVLAVLLAACGSAASPSPTASPTGDGTPVPKPSRWPGTAVLAVIKLGQLDGEIAKAGQDFVAAADTGDLELMWGAADGLAKLIADVDLSVQHLSEWDKTADLAATLGEAYPLMREGAIQLRDAITAGDAEGVQAGSTKLAEGLTVYAPVRPTLADLVPEALLQQRILNL